MREKDDCENDQSYSTHKGKGRLQNFLNRFLLMPAFWIKPRKGSRVKAVDKEGMSTGAGAYSLDPHFANGLLFSISLTENAVSCSGILRITLNTKNSFHVFKVKKNFSMRTPTSLSA